MSSGHEEQPGVLSAGWGGVSKETLFRNSLEVQWSGLCTSNAGHPGSTPGQGTTIGYHKLRGIARKKKNLKSPFS